MVNVRDIMKSKIDVLLVIEGEIATTHLIEHMLSACRRQGIVYRKKLLSELLISDIQKSTIPFFVRCGDPSLRLWIERLQQARHPYIYYLDDNFWKIEGDTPLARYYQHPSIRHSLETALAHAHRVLTNSDLLAEFLRGLNDKVDVLPSFFDFSLLEHPPKEALDEVRIGFAGSSSRMADLDIIKPVIQSVLDTHPKTVFEFIGVMPEDLKTSDRIRFFPHTADYESFIRFKEKRQWSIGLAPLIDSYSNRCKTNNKYREYSACRIPGIYSNLPPYQRAVTEGKTGLLVDNSPVAWTSAINQLLLNAPLREEIASQAHEDAFEKHCVERVSVVWAEQFTHVHRYMMSTRRSALKNNLRSYMTTRFLKVESLWIRASNIYSQGGLRLLTSKIFNRIKLIFSRKTSI
jgi:glycosyltransferase involved in cell wall biosynthesis